MTFLAAFVASSMILSLAQQEQTRSGWEYIGQVWENGRGSEQRAFAGFHERKQDCIDQISSIENQVRETAGSTSLQYSFVCMNRTGSRDQNVVGYREIIPEGGVSNATRTTSNNGGFASHSPQNAANIECLRIVRSGDRETANIIEQDQRMLDAVCHGILLGGRDVAASDNSRVLAACRSSIARLYDGATPAEVEGTLNQNVDRLNLSPTKALNAIRFCEVYRQGMMDGLRRARGFLD